MNQSLHLADHFLIAMPSLTDGIFSGSVVYLCEHNEDGAMGMVLNKPAPFSFDDIADELDIVPKAHIDPIIHMGGPVSRQHGFILHSPHGNWDSSLAISERVSVSSSKDILHAIADGWGPNEYRIALGYAGWESNQLEHELADNAWLTVKADHHTLFHTPPDDLYHRALSLLGITPAALSSDLGHG